MMLLEIKVILCFNYLVANGLLDEEPIVEQKTKSPSPLKPSSTENSVNSQLSPELPPYWEPDLTLMQHEPFTKETESAFISPHEQSASPLTPLQVQSPSAVEPYLPLLQNELPHVELPLVPPDDFHDSDWGAAEGVLYSFVVNCH